MKLFSRAFLAIVVLASSVAPPSVNAQDPVEGTEIIGVGYCYDFEEGYFDWGVKYGVASAQACSDLCTDAAPGVVLGFSFSSSVGCFCEFSNNTLPYPIGECGDLETLESLVTHTVSYFVTKVVLHNADGYAISIHCNSQ